MTFELMSTMNIVVTVVYWGTLHSKRMQEPDMADPRQKFAVYNGHLAPFVFNWVNFALTDVVIAPKHSVINLWMGMAYAYVNYKETMRRGRPLYHWATWEDIPKTSGVFALIVAIAIAVWLCLACITKDVKRRPSKYSKTAQKAD